MPEGDGLAAAPKSPRREMIYHDLWVVRAESVGLEGYL